MKKYMVALSYYRAIDDLELDYFYSDSIEECQKEVRKFIETNEVFASEWDGGNLYDITTNEHLGVIAYNGKYLPKQVNVGKSTYINIK